MSFFINKRRFLVHLLILTGLFALAVLLQEKNPFEGGTYTQFTLSILEDGDFNLINQIKDPAQNWLSTVTGNHSNYEHPAIAVYLFPFIAYQSLFSNSLGLTTAHVLATIFFLMIGLILLKKLLDRLGIKQSRNAIIVTALSTPFIWFSFFASINSNIFSLVYSVVVLSAFVLNPKKDSIWVYFFLGISLTLGFAIRIQQFWIVFLFLYLLSIDKLRSVNKVFYFLLGAFMPLSLILCNLYLRSGNFMHPHHVYTSWTSLGEFWNSTLPYALFGPNGYFILSPIYILYFIFGICLFFMKFDNKKLYSFLVIPPTFLFLYYSMQWPIMDSLAGRHQLDYFFLYAFITGFSLDYSKKYKKGYYALWSFIILCILWNIRTHIAYFYIDNSQPAQWQFFYFVSPDYILGQIKEIPGLLNPLRNLIEVIYFFPLITLLAYFTHLFERYSVKENIRFCYVFILWGFGFYLLFTQLNIFNNSKNVRTYSEQGIYKDKVITSANVATFYDDFIETHYKTLRWHLMQNDCVTAMRIIEIKEEFLKAVKDEIIYDPIGFVDGLTINNPKSSYLNEQNLEEINSALEVICPF